jgi:[ribosomal protein S18]-alanine N-acetyltransferase
MIARAVIEIRRLSLHDLDAIERIENAVYPTPWSRSMFAGELAKPSSLSLGGFDPDSGRLIAYLIVSRYVDAWHIMNLAVHPGWRRAGVASRLLDELLDLTAGDGRRGYTLEVRVSNTAAIALYGRFGFEASGVRRGYYTDNREDALIMWKDPIAEGQSEGG